VFSDTQCGAHASVRQLRDLNVMDPSSAPVPYPREGNSPSAYPPSYPQGDGYYPSDTTADDYGSDPYVSAPYVVVHDRYRRTHPPHRNVRPHPHAHN
jgi:hypothetical protein